MKKQFMTLSLVFMRITSLLAQQSFQVIEESLPYNRYANSFTTNIIGLNEGFVLYHWEKFIENHGADQLRRFYQQLRNLSQQAIYVICCMTLLYAFVEDSFDVVFITVLNFGLFFILDDWQIMHQYSEKAQGNLLRKHRLLIYSYQTLYGNL